jgi:uncharacterized protein
LTAPRPHSRPTLPRFIAGVFLGGLLLALAVAFNGCHQDPPKPDREPGTVDVRLGSRTYRLWVAATENTRRYGLMKRESMPADRGMIFVFRTQQPLTFWMKDTLIPLDILYLNAQGKVVSIHRMLPNDKDAFGEYVTTPSDAPSKYAIELNAGQAAASGVKVGDQIDLPPAATAPEGLE